MTSELQKALRRAGGNAVANHHAEQVGADNAQDAAEGRADQPLQADRAQANLEQDDGRAIKAPASASANRCKPNGCRK